MDCVRFSDLRKKEVINLVNGHRLGMIVDMDVQVPEGRVLSIVVPAPVKLAGLFRGEQGGYVIPWQRICKIGDDVILVELDDAFFGGLTTDAPRVQTRE